MTLGCADELSRRCSRAVEDPFVFVSVVDEGFELPALMAAFRMCANGGLIPHVRQGGIGNASVTIAGSKFDGTGFVKVQIGQTQLAAFV